MANTSIQLKKSGVTGNSPIDLGLGELAINYADGKLYYKNDLDQIKYITNQDSFATIIANSIPIIATSTNDILSIQANGGIKIAADGFTKTITIGVDESGLTSFVRKTGDTMTGDLHVDSANVYSNYSIINKTLYSGLATHLATPLPNVIAQFTSNSESYIQVNQQNIDERGSADFVVTADVGTDTDFYVDVGLLNSQFIPGSFNGLGTAGHPLDGYLVVQGSTIGQPGGNLVIGTVTTGTSGLNTKIVSGGSSAENVIAEFGQTSVKINRDLTVTGNTYLNGLNIISFSQASFTHANAAYNQANTGTSLAQSAYDFANSISQVINTGFPIVDLGLIEETLTSFVDMGTI